MALQNSTNRAIFYGQDQPNNPRTGDRWIQTFSNGSIFFEWWWNGFNWESQFKNWDFSNNATAAFKAFFPAAPQIVNFDISAFVFNIMSMMSVAATSTTAWNFNISKVAENNTYTSLGTATNLNTAANTWNRQEIFTNTKLSFFTTKMIVVDATPGSSAQRLFFASSLMYKIVKA